MARKARKNSIDPSVIQVVHTWNRCVRRLVLCGIDPITGADCEYRREWSRARLLHLASVFAIEVLTYAIMGNHTHMVLRSRPDIARQWTPEMIARRWLTLTPRTDRTGNIVDPTPAQIQAIVDDSELVEKLRLQLSDISWWMRSYAQHIAKRANLEDDMEGHFWQQRYKAHVLVDEASMLRCMMYVDLNPIRAGLADSIEDSDYTGAKDRFDDLRVHVATKDGSQIILRFDSGSDTSRWERLEHQCSGWLSPIEIDGQRSEAHCETVDMEEQVARPRSRRVSQRGAVRIPLTKYLLLLDLIGRQQRPGGSGFIPDEVVPILQRLNIEATGFIESILCFGQRFRSIAYRCRNDNVRLNEVNALKQVVAV